MSLLKFLATGLLLSLVLRAQETPPPHANLEVGVRALAGDHNSAQFDEYRDIHPGIFLQGFQGGLDDLFHRHYFLTFQTRNDGREDQAFRATFGRTGKFRLEVGYYSTPHDFSSAAATLFAEILPGVFTVPPAVRATLVNDPASLPFVLQGATPLDVALQRKLASYRLEYTPNGAWTLSLRYSHENENGGRPFGAMLNGFANMLEVPEPIDYRVHEAGAGVEYGNRRGGFQADYTASFFENQIPALVFDNPFRYTDALGGSSRGRMALYPDNSAQSLNFAGALNLSDSTRLMAAISPEWMRQNAGFLPYTINSLANVPALPASSLNGQKTRLSMNYTLASHPLRNVSLTAHYRDYDYMNDTRSLVFPAYVQSDMAVTNRARQSLPYGFNHQDAGLEATWLLHKNDALTIGYDFDTLDRTYRDAAKTHEHSGSVKLDLNPRKWITFQGGFTHAQRDPQAYVLNGAIDPMGPPAGSVPLPDGWRMFDEAARTRNKGSALVELDPSERLSLTGSFDTLQDRFNDSLYGLLASRSVDYTLDASYLWRRNITVFGNYAYERYQSDQRSREYAAAMGSAPVNSNPNNDWASYIRDGIHTAGGGISASGIRGKVTCDLFYSLSMAKGQIANRALGNPLLPGFLVTAIQDYPETGNRFHTVTGAVRYQISRDVFAKLEYDWERFDRADFQIAGIVPDMARIDPRNSTSILLGADVPGYQVHIVSVSLEYRF